MKVTALPTGETYLDLLLLEQHSWPAFTLQAAEQALALSMAVDIAYLQ